MRGEPIEAVKTGLASMISDLKKNAYALETAWLSVISYDSEARVLAPLTELADFIAPELPVPETSPTNLGEALQLLMGRYGKEVIRTTKEKKGDFLPLLIVMTDGKPTDTLLYKNMLESVKAKRFAKIIACAAGPKAKVEPLKQLTEEVYALDTMDNSTVQTFWQWVSMAVQSERVDALPPPPPEIRLV